MTVGGGCDPARALPGHQLELEMRLDLVDGGRHRRGSDPKLGCGARYVAVPQGDGEIAHGFQADGHTGPPVWEYPRILRGNCKVFSVFHINDAGRYLAATHRLACEGGQDVGRPRERLEPPASPAIDRIPVFHMAPAPARDAAVGVEFVVPDLGKADPCGDCLGVILLVSATARGDPDAGVGLDRRALYPQPVSDDVGCGRAAPLFLYVHRAGPEAEIRSAPFDGERQAVHAWGPDSRQHVLDPGQRRLFLDGL